MNATEKSIHYFAASSLASPSSFFYNETMKLDRILKVTSDQFYDYVEEQFIKDVEKATSRVIKPRDMKDGFKYIRNDQNGKIVIYLDHYTRGKTYAVRTTQGNFTASTSYTTEETPEGLHTIMEFYDSSFEKKKDKMNKLSRNFNELVYYSRMSSQIGRMASHIIKKANGLPIREEPPGVVAARHVSNYFQKKFKRNKDDENE